MIHCHQSRSEEENNVLKNPIQEYIGNHDLHCKKSLFRSVRRASREREPREKMAAGLRGVESNLSEVN